MKRINIDLPEELIEDMKGLADKLQVKLGFVYREAIEKYLKTKKDK